MLRAIIIDDEQAGIDTIKILASRYSESVRAIAFTQSPKEGIRLIEDYHPDVVFLDINMPTMSGFELLSHLSYRNFRLVFITAHRDYAIEAIKNRAFDYLLKPLTDEDFRQCVLALKTPAQYNTGEGKGESGLFVEIQVKDGVLYLKQKDIVRVEASRSYTEFYLVNGIKHIASKSLKDFESKLDHVLFFRCHKSHIINLEKVQKFVHHDGLYALMCDGSMPDIARPYKEEFLHRLKTMR